MWGDDIEAALKAAEEREQGCPSDPLLAEIWRDERDGREWHPDPIMREALNVTSHLPETGSPEVPPPAPKVRPEAVGGGDPYGDTRKMQDAVRESMWRQHGYRGEMWQPGVVAR